MSDNSRTGVIKMWPVAFTAQGERVAAETKSYAEMKNGKTYQNYYHVVFVVRDGLIQSVKDPPYSKRSADRPFARTSPSDRSDTVTSASP
jgi:hypothetical protein